MNKTRAIPNRVGVLVIAFLAVSLSASTAYGTEVSKHRLTHKELKELIANAATPADHQKIAAYYRGEAQRLRQTAKEHQEWGDIYAKGSAGSESKHPGMSNGAPHCHKWADLEEEEAKEADALAAAHDDMAKAPK